MEACRRFFLLDTTNKPLLILFPTEKNETSGRPDAGGGALFEDVGSEMSDFGVDGSPFFLT